jgi:molecular chaperone GrpE
MKALAKQGIKPVDTEGLFNPNHHEVMFEAPGTGEPAGTIIQVMEPGYMIHDRLLRPARVGVAAKEKGKEPDQAVDVEA